METPTLSEFHKIEYQSLRKEIETSVKESRDLERNALVLTGIIWTWLATHKDAVTNRCFYWIPAVIVVAAIFRSAAILLAIRKIAKYIVTLEKIYAGSSAAGWEIFGQKNRDHQIWMSGALFWIVLFFATLVAPSLMQ